MAELKMLHSIRVPILFAILIAAALCMNFLRRRGSRKYKYPPGPKGVPIFGNLFQLPSAYPGPQLAKWSKEYGDMFTLQIGGNKWVFLNSMKTARELLDQRGKLYISRPDFAISQDILSGGNRIVLMQYNQRWRNLRRIMHQLLMASNSDTYKPFQDVESKSLLWEYLHRPEEFYQHGARFANSVIFSVVFGRRTTMQDKNTRLLFSTIDDFIETQLSPSSGFMEQFPRVARAIPKPLQWFRPKAERVFKKTVGVYAAFVDDLERRIKEGQDPKCFARDMAALGDKYNFDDAQKYFCIGSIIEAGSDTTRNQINIMLAAAATYPAWVATAQKELDSICGYAARLPDFDDWERLPYIVAIIKESLRWRPNMTSSGTPRALIEDDKFGPYVFEKGTIFSYNHFSISHDEKEFPENEKFKPERFMNEELYDMLKGHLGFGAGRRLCPGWHLGIRNMFIAFSRLLYCFDFREVPGEPIDPVYIDALAHDHPPFKVHITPRSPDHAHLIQRECVASAEELDALVRQSKK